MSLNINKIFDKYELGLKMLDLIKSKISWTIMGDKLWKETYWDFVKTWKISCFMT